MTYILDRIAVIRQALFSGNTYDIEAVRTACDQIEASLKQADEGKQTSLGAGHPSAQPPAPEPLNPNAPPPLSTASTDL